MSMPGEEHDPLETPHCEVHPTVRLVDARDDLAGRDARWACLVPGCSYVRLA